MFRIGIFLIGVSSAEAQTKLQIVNPDRQTAIRVMLDRQVIETVQEDGSLGSAARPFPLPSEGRHVLIAEATSARIKGQFEWASRGAAPAWLVVRFYAGRGEGDPGFFIFSLQDWPALTK